MGHFERSFLRGWYGDLTAEADFDSGFNTHACLTFSWRSAVILQFLDVQCE